MASRVEHFDEDDPVIKLLLQGDKRCRFDLETRIKKISEDSSDEKYPIGSVGKVIGSAFVNDMDCYLVHFDEDPDMSVTFIIGSKIDKE